MGESTINIKYENVYFYHVRAHKMAYNSGYIINKIVVLCFCFTVWLT